MTRPAADVLVDLALLVSQWAVLIAELAEALRSAAGAPPRPANEAPAVFTTREAAVVLGVSVRTLQALRAEGRCPAFFRVGRAVRYARAELAAACGRNQTSAPRQLWPAPRSTPWPTLPRSRRDRQRSRPN